MKKYFILICFGFIIGSVKSQELKEIETLENMVRDYFYKSHGIFELDAISKSGRPSEAFFLTLDIDSSGNVAMVHLFSEETKDSAYAIFKNLSPFDFSNWKQEKYKRKSIIIPVVVLNSSNTPKHVLYLADMTATRKQVRGLIIGKTVGLGWTEIKFNHGNR